MEDIVVTKMGDYVEIQDITENETIAFKVIIF